MTQHVSVIKTPPGSPPFRSSGPEITARQVVFTGTGAVVGTLLAMSILATRRGKSLTEVLNTSTHIFDRRAETTDSSFSFQRTGLGTMVNIGAAFFWGSVAAYAMANLQRRGTGGKLAAGCLTATVAGTVDYGLLPRRLTPGWEFVLPPTDIAIIFACMGTGISAGSIIEAQTERRNGLR